MSAVLELTKIEPITIEKFFLSPFSETHELIEGELVPIMPAGFLHGVVAQELANRLSAYSKKNKLGIVATAETGFVLGEKTVRGADVSFVSNEQLAEFGIPESYFPTAPALAVEVVSPSNSSDEMIEKISLYLNAGSKIVWIVYPKQKMIHVHRQSNVINVLREADELDGEDVLPNFRLKLSEIFNP